MFVPVVRFRVDFALPCSVGPGKIALLEGIARTGSLSQAARELGMSYRRGWDLLASLNASFREPVAVTATGGRGGGGARLTRFGAELINRYRLFERDTQARAQKAFKPIAQQARARAPGATKGTRARAQRALNPRGPGDSRFGGSARAAGGARSAARER
jgi:molybdate transport system regulatory protein